MEDEKVRRLEPVPGYPQEVPARSNSGHEPYSVEDEPANSPYLRQADIVPTDRLLALALAVLDLRVTDAKFLAEKLGNQSTVDLMVSWAEVYQEKKRDMEPLVEKRRV